MKLSRTLPDSVARQAAEWTEILKKADSAERAAFDEWLTESPQHVREFLLMTSVDRALDDIDPARAHDVQTLLAQATRDGIVELDTHRYRGASPRARAAVFGTTWRRGALIAASLAIIATGIFIWQSMRWQEFSTGVGEQRTVQLTDGTVVTLNTQSHLRVHLTKRSRDLQLDTGQALFKVGQDPNRPFRVTAGRTSIQAIGTQFDVYRRGDASVTVSVLEGRVQVSQRDLLSAGQGIDMTPDGTVRDHTTTDGSSTLAWQQRRLVFRRDKLSKVVDEFNRYNRAPRFRLEDAQAASRHYSGEFDADDPASLLQLLSKDPGLSVVRHGDEVIIKQR